MTSSRTAAGSGLLGREEPRLWSRPLRELTPDTSFGFEAIEVVESMLGETLFPWQKWFLKHSLELAPGSFTYDEFPMLRFKTVLLLVSRQNGKSFIMSRRLLWRMLMWDGPETEPPLILGAAHKLPAALEIMELSAKAVKRSSIHKKLVTWNRGSGSQLLEFSNGSRYKCEAASDDGGRGLSVTDLAFDELRQQRDWDAWSALTNTTNARHSSQTIAVSNAGTAKSDVLRSLRKQALGRIDDWERLVESGELDVDTFASKHDTTLGLFEWSAPENAGLWDRDAWAQSNPSLGHANGEGVVLLTEANMASKAAQVGKPGEDGVPEYVFRTENYCNWVTADVSAIFGDGFWETQGDPLSEIVAGSQIVASVDVSHNRAMSYLAVAGFRPDGKTHVEVILQRAGTEWVVPYLSEHFHELGAESIVVQGRGAPASALIEHLEAANIPVTRCEGSDLAAVHGGMFDAVRSGDVFHVGDQDVLNVAAAAAVVKDLGDVQVLNRSKSPVDVAPLVAVEQARWGLSILKTRAGKQTVSSYETRGLVVV